MEDVQRTDRVSIMDSRPRVSVVIPAYNSTATLERALHSVFAQTVAPFETLVVDDCSTDGTPALAEKYADKGVRLVALRRRSGAAGARNAGIHAAQGELIAFLDSDDEWLPQKLEKQLDVIMGDDRLALVSCASNLISPDGKDLGDLYGGHPPLVGPDVWKSLLVSNFIATPTVLARRAQLISLGCFDPRLKIGEDQDMWIRLALAGHVGFVTDSLVRVYGRQSSLSAWDLEEQLQYTLPMIERHVRALSGRLTAAETRTIRRERIGRLGRVAYGKGQRLRGARMVLEAVLLGYRPLESLYYLVNASGPATWLKGWIRQGALK
jgi:glycosyltransferase involved in cell wall biosynthesis